MKKLTSKKEEIKKLTKVWILIIFGILFRTAWHIGPNIEFVTCATLLASWYLDRKWSVIIPLTIMIISDLILGNSKIFIFTWSAYIIIALMSSNIAGRIRLSKHGSKMRELLVKYTALGAGGSIWFFIWTNFGVWLLDSWGMYPKTIYGLMNAYIMGIPFFRYNLLSNIIIVPVSFIVVEMIQRFCLNQNLQNIKQVNNI
jgi:hypothetical protein